MKSLKTSSLFRLAALLVIAVIAICLVGFVAEGWQSEPQKQPESGETDENSGNTDENTDGGETVTPTPPTPPEYVHYLTGLEVSAADYGQKPLCFITDTAAPTYGIYGASLMIEIPIEGGKSRFLVYQNDIKNLGKIGSITQGRDCIARLLDFFGGISVQNGSDDMHPAGTSPSRIIFDLSQNSGYSYEESSSYLYSNKDLLLAGLQNAGIGLGSSEGMTMPFHFTPHFSDAVTFTTTAQTITLPFGASNETNLYYDTAAGQYLLGKGGQIKTDLLNGKNVGFTNAFVLFADSTTYESVDQTKMIVDTDGGGKGYYFTHGTACAIEWHLDAAGKLVFKNENGEVLSANRGTSYIAFYKASLASGVVFS